MTADREDRPRPVTIFVNNNEVEIPDKNTTGQEIKERAGVPLDFTLYRKRGDKLDEIENDEAIKVHEHEHFIAVSGQDVS